MGESCPKIPYKRDNNPAKTKNKSNKRMLPLFGRTRKAAAAEIPMENINDEWCIPSDQELYGRSKAEKMKIEAGEKAEMIENRDIETISDMKIVSDITNAENITNVTGNVTCDSVSFQSMNNDQADDVVIMSESEINFSNYTFSIMNNETTIVDTVVINENFPTECAFKTVLERLVTLERKFEDLNIKVTKMEEDAQKGNSSDSNASIFVNEFVGFMQDVMKSGLSYQQRVLGKFIDELDTMFEFDFTDFAPLQ